MTPLNVSPGALEPFNEAVYLALHSDVRAAVETGAIASGWAHYEAYGRSEGRSLCSINSRVAQLLAGLDIANSRGIEIGALDKPIVKKGDSDILYVDFASSDYLRVRYKDDPNVVTENLVEVDGIWGQKTLFEAVGSSFRADYVIASHVIEHVPDVVSWLREIHDTLIDGGSLRLAVPDRRYTFDYTRRESVLADALDAYIRQPRVPLPRQILDFCLNARKVDAGLAWHGPLDIQSLKREFSDRDALKLARDSFQNQTYHDVHCWVFTPDSFVKLMRELVEFELLDMRCEALRNTRRGHFEFMVSMRPDTDRRKMLDSWDNPVIR